ncbi:MAG: 5'/3'-nucleotidase SurE [Proteobacteria bacterium]|nr:5'/3'-nucleotidase SurE [Pseudomonadota bacterium]
MRILLCNDDGIHAQGLKILERIARQFSDDIWIIAPEKNHSGAGHSLTLSYPLRIREISDHKFAIDGTPTDCIFIAANHIMKEYRPDLVLSGVNFGGNLGEDITYSGTVAAAMEATLFKIPAFALSLVVNEGEEVYWTTPEHFGPEVIDKLLKSNISENVFINVNFPNIPISNVTGFQLTYQGQRHTEDKLEERIDPRGKKYYWIGAVTYGTDFEEGSDLFTIEKGAISITPLSIDFTEKQTLSYLKQVFLK